MAISQNDLNDWFRYHPPTDETAPKHRGVSAVFSMLQTRIGLALGAVGDPAVKRFALDGTTVGPADASAFDLVNASLRAAVEEIDRLVPDCADKTVAVRALRFVRMAANKALVEQHRMSSVDDRAMRATFDHGPAYYVDLVFRELTSAEFWCNAAIAIAAAQVARVLAESKTP